MLDGPETVELICARVDEVSVPDGSLSLSKRTCSECGTAVWFSPFPEAPEDRCVIVCSRCRFDILLSAEWEVRSEEELEFYRRLLGTPFATPEEISHVMRCRVREKVIQSLGSLVVPRAVGAGVN